MFIDFRERENKREEERNIDWLPPIHALNPQPRYVPLPGIELSAFWCLG